ncbi:hypothetical protein HWV62_42360 [Athelia sp. TMB]|nr:hypothetical protein HWV62_42360 [Athelia sp. TMB]
MSIIQPKMTSPGPPIETWSAVITPLAAKLNLTPELSSITLANVLSGETCQPISSQCDLSILIPHLPNRASLERRTTGAAFPPPIAIPSSSKQQLPDPTHVAAISPEYRAFRKECMDVVATFVKANSPKQLNLDAVVRDTLIRDLRHSTHPDVIRSWELHEHSPDEESYTLIQKIPPPEVLISGSHLDLDAESGDGNSIDTEEKRAIAPFADEFCSDASSGPLTVPKVFGPERVTVDPRIKALHARLFYEMIAFGLVMTACELRLTLQSYSLSLAGVLAPDQFGSPALS